MTYEEKLDKMIRDYKDKQGKEKTQYISNVRFLMNLVNRFEHENGVKNTYIMLGYKGNSNLWRLKQNPFSVSHKVIKQLISRIKR